MYCSMGFPGIRRTRKKVMVATAQMVSNAFATRRTTKFPVTECQTATNGDSPGAGARDCDAATTGYLLGD